jgi:hypothetical protein
METLQENRRRTIMKRNAWMTTLTTAALAVAMTVTPAMGVFAENAAEPETTKAEYTLTPTIKKTLVKDANDYIPAETYTFQVTPAAVTEGTMKDTVPVRAGDLAYLSNDIDDSGKYTITGKPSASDTGEGKTSVLVGTQEITFSFPEAATPGIYRYEISEVAGGDTEETYDSSTYTMDVYYYKGAEDTKVTLSKGGTKFENAEFTNDISGGGDDEQGHKDLTVTKTVTGNMGDTTKDFEFKITGTNLTAGNQYLVTKVDSAKKETAVTDVLTNGAQITINLKSGESLKVYGLTATDVVTVNETDYTADGYTTKIDNVAGREVEKQIAVDTTVAVENHKEVTTPTGIAREFGPYIAMLSLAAALIAVFARRKRNV